MNPVAVLVVEDIPQVRATAVRMFRGMGYDVSDAYNGDDALKQLRERPEIGVLFADVRMPGLSGPELAEAARRLRPDLAVILTSGYITEESVLEDVVFVRKPWRPHDLERAVKRVLSRSMT